VLAIRSEILLAALVPCLAASLLVPSSDASAQSPAQSAGQAAGRLGGPELTPVGAERAGNADGTIPSWTGGITQPPSDYVPGRMHTDPFRDDTVLYTIDAANLAEHEAHVSDGHKALLAANPDTLRLAVYPTRRSASYPDWIYEAVAKNASEARLSTAGKGGVTEAFGSSPFPIPSRAVEVLWNHLLRFRGQRVSRIHGTAAVTRGGRYSVILSKQEYLFAFSYLRDSAIGRRFPNIVFALRSRVFSPALLSGDGLLGIEPIDQTHDPRKVWSYNRALRRVVRQPHFAYDFTQSNSDGLRTVDDGELFNGPPDRYEWKLLGKREVIIPYNAYRLHGPDVSDADILERSHVSPDLARYELHRVWVIEGRLREGERHIYGRRVFYIDEDSWQISLAESYDLEGRLWRVGESHAVNYYEVPVHWTTLVTFYDLRARRYLVNGLDNGRAPHEFSTKADPREFSPIALNYYVR
jgi:hypothetical protein